MVLNQSFIKEFKGILECDNLINAHSSVQYCNIAHLSVRISLVNIAEPVLYEIHTLAFPFDFRCESVTYISNMHA